MEYYTVLAETAVAADFALSRPSGYALRARAKARRGSAKLLRRSGSASAFTASAVTLAGERARTPHGVEGSARRPAPPGGSHSSPGGRWSPSRRTSPSGGVREPVVGKAPLPAKSAPQEAADKAAGLTRPHASAQEYRIKLRVSAFEQRRRELGHQLREELDVIRDSRLGRVKVKSRVIDDTVAALGSAPSPPNSLGAMRHVRRSAAAAAAEAQGGSWAKTSRCGIVRPKPGAARGS